MLSFAHQAQQGGDNQVPLDPGGEPGAAMWETVSGEGGWPSLLELYRSAA
jgi:hypothetical protein